jgi:hypothetical protein
VVRRRVSAEGKRPDARVDEKAHERDRARL